MSSKGAGTSQVSAASLHAASTLPFYQLSMAKIIELCASSILRTSCQYESSLVIDLAALHQYGCSVSQRCSHKSD